MLPEHAWVDWEVALAALAAHPPRSARRDYRTALDAAGRGRRDRGPRPAARGSRRTGSRSAAASWPTCAWRRSRRWPWRAPRSVAPTSPAAERAARAAVEAAPFRESARAALMEVLRAGGNVAEALRVYEDLRTVLRDELGATPSARRGGAARPAPARRRGAAGAEPPPPAAPAARRRSLRLATPRDGTPDRRARQRGDRCSGRCSATPRAGEGRRRADRGPGRDRQDAACWPRLRARRRPTAVRGAVGARQRARARVPVRRRAPAVRGRCWATPARRERRSPARPRRRARCSSAGARGATAGDDARFAALHGLFWLALNLAADGAAAARGRRPALGRPAVAALPRLPAAPARGAADRWSPRRCAPASRHRRRAARRDRPGPGDRSRVRPGPLSAAAVDELVRERLGADADARSAPPCHGATGGNPLLLRQLLRALEAEGVQPDAAHADVVREIGPRAVSRTRAAAARPAGRGRGRGGARGRGARRERGPAGDRPRWPGSTSRPVAAAAAALARAEILRPERPLGFVHPLVRDAVYHDLPARRARAAPRARGAPAARRGRAARAGRGASAGGAAPRRRSGSSTLLSDAAARGDAQGARPRARWRTCSARSRSRRPPTQLPRVLFELGVAEMLTRGPAAAEHLRGGLRGV